MLSKLITYGKTREEAIQIMLKAIEDYEIEGVQTTLPFGKFVFEHEAFRSGNFNTHFVTNYYSPEILKQKAEEDAAIAAVIALKQYLADKKILRTPTS
jgi:acetyl/propionyl-CoA carboxylase alpha subunit